MGNMPQGKMKIYYPRCTVCAYMKENPEWYRQLKLTSYFDPTSPETAIVFFNRTAPPLDKRAFYRHLKNHTTRLKNQITAARERQGRNGFLPQVTIDAEAFNVDSTSDHVDALNDVIKKFHQSVRQGKIPLTLQGGLSAIKIKADIEKSNKDRKVDLFKAFSSMGNKKSIDGTTETSE